MIINQAASPISDYGSPVISLTVIAFFFRGFGL